MAHKRKRGEVWEYTFKREGLLDKPLYLTFKTEAEGDAFTERLEALLDRGIVPPEYQPKARIKVLSELIREYERDAHPSAKDQGVLGTVLKRWGDSPLASLNVDWVDQWVTEMKREDKLAPSTILSKVGAMARCTDWGVRKKYLLMPDHPFRTLPDGYARYTKLDTALAGVERVDIERDRRLERGEHEKVLAVLDVGVLPRKQRSLQLAHVPALRCLFILAQESAMRLREMYTLTLDQVDLAQSTVFLERTKNGSKRQVPLSTDAKAALQSYLKVREHSGAGVFPWWTVDDFNRKNLHALTDYLSSLFASIFDAAGCKDLRFHDLRHEATSRLFERTTMRDTEIAQITGHRSLKMLMRYANLRGSQLSQRMW